MYIQNQLGCLSKIREVEQMLQTLLNVDFILNILNSEALDSRFNGHMIVRSFSVLNPRLRILEVLDSRL